MTEQVFSASEKGVSNNNTQSNKLSFFSLFGAIISLNLILWAGYWAYSLISRDINGIPIVAAQPGPLRVAPEVPGGIEAENIELAVSKIASQELPPNPQAVELAPYTAKLNAGDITINQAMKQKKLIDSQIEKRTQGHLQAVEPELLNEISMVPIKTSIESTDYTIVDNQSELVAAALAIALKQNSEQLSNKAISGNIKSSIIKPMPRPGSLWAKPTSLNSENSILPTLGSVEPGLAVVQFGSFENKQLALAEWGRLSENLSIILDGRPKFVESIQRNGNEIYRLRLGGFVNIDDASRFCSAVISQENCVPIIAK